MPLEVEVVDYRYLLRLFFPLSTADVELESIPVAVEVAVVELMVLRLHFPLSTANVEL